MATNGTQFILRIEKKKFQGVSRFWIFFAPFGILTFSYILLIHTETWQQGIGLGIALLFFIFMFITDLTKIGFEEITVGDTAITHYVNGRLMQHIEYGPSVKIYIGTLTRIHDVKYGALAAIFIVKGEMNICCASYSGWDINDVRALWDCLIDLIDKYKMDSDEQLRKYLENYRNGTFARSRQ